jgi:cytochrome P450
VDNGPAHDSTAKSGPMPDDWWQHHFDPNSLELAPRLYETLAPMRDRCPVAHSDVYDGLWVATKYEDILEVAQDWETFSSAHGLTVPTAPIAVRNLPVEVDPPVQRVYKRLINPFFTPRAVAAYEQTTRELVNRLIDNFIESGACEFMDDFARPFPSRAFFEMVISAPPGDIDRVAYMASKASLPNDPEAGECWLGLSAWIRDFIEERRRGPERSDVVDAVIRATVDGRPITDDEIIGIIQLIILGGLETTASALGLWFHRFCAQPEIPALLRATPERIPDAVEELLRIDSPFISIARTAVRDGKIGDQTISNGDKVVLYWASANRDTAEFATPDDFRLGREHNRHFAFGVGPHRCAGSNLARLNLRIGLEESLRRLHDIRLQDGADIHFHSTTTRSPLTLPITFTPGPRLAGAGN